LFENRGFLFRMGAAGGGPIPAWGGRSFPIRISFPDTPVSLERHPASPAREKLSGDLWGDSAGRQRFNSAPKKKKRGVMDGGKRGNGTVVPKKVCGGPRGPIT